MTSVKQALQILKSLAPEEHAFKAEYDNVGLLFGDDNANVSRVLVCLDATDAVIDEAIALKVELIVSHHPFIFAPIKRINAADLMGRKILKAAKHGINIYSSHTNLDFVAGGINDYMASLLALRGVSVLDPYIDERQGLGRVGDLASKVDAVEFKNHVATMLKDSRVRIIASDKATVKRIAVINGAGGGDTKYIDMAIAAGADCLVSADVKHHVAVYAKELGFTLIEPEHYTTEHVYLNRLTQILKIEAKSQDLGLEVIQSKSDVNPRN